MKVPEVIRRPGDLRKEMERKQTRIDTLRRFAQQLTAPPREVKVKSSPDPARFQAFSALPDERMIRIMELRYLEERSWEEIAEEMWISESRMFKLHKAAVAALGSNEE